MGGKRRADGALNDAENSVRITKAYFALGRMNIHVHGIWRNDHVEHDDGVTLYHQCCVIRLDHRVCQCAVLNPTMVDEKEHMLACGAVERGRRDVAGYLGIGDWSILTGLGG